MEVNRKGEQVIMITFNNMSARQRVYTRRTALKDVPGIWLNEDLTSFRKPLNFQACTLFRENLITRNWTYLGDIFVQLGEDTEPIQVSSEGELCYVAGLQHDYKFPARPPLEAPVNNGIDYTKEPPTTTTT